MVCRLEDAVTSVGLPDLPCFPADAKMELTRAKMEDTRCAKFNGFITQMEALRMGLQAAAENRDMVDTLRAGTASLTAAMGGRDLVGEMDDVSDDMQEAMGDIREVSDRFAQPLGLSALTGVSDDDLEREMAALEGEMAAPAYVPAAAAPVAPPAYTPTAAYTPAAPAGLPAVPSGMPLPTVPTAAPATGARAAVALAAPAAPAAAAAAPASAFDDLLAEMS